MPDRDGGAPADKDLTMKDLCDSYMDPADAALLPQAPADLRMDREIRLMRVVLARLSQDTTNNHATVMRATAVLSRRTRLQYRQYGNVSDFEQALMEEAEMVLKQDEGDEGRNGYA